MEKAVEVVRAYESGKPDSLIVVVPKELRKKHKFAKGTKFLVKEDEQGRIIYEPIKEEEKPIDA